MRSPVRRPHGDQLAAHGGVSSPVALPQGPSAALRNGSIDALPLIKTQDTAD